MCHAEFINMQVILTDGDPCTLRNMKENMELNNLCIEQEDSRVLKESKNKVG
jgi:ribosomal protein L11 methylase PrmA